MIEDKYIYLLGGLMTLALVTVIFFLRKDMRRFIIKAGILGGIAGLVSEIWYFVDYWKPPTTLGVAVSSPEDFIFGFAFVALGATIVPFIFKKPFETTHGAWKKTAIPMLLIILVSLLIFTNLLGINSLIVTTILPAALTIYMIIRDPSLWKRAAFGAAFVGFWSIVAYAVVIGVLSPDYFDKYYLFHGQAWNPTLFGIMPLLEWLWYMAIGAVSATAFEYMVRRTRIKKAAK